jgi:hypothetical protein
MGLFTTRRAGFSAAPTACSADEPVHRRRALCARDVGVSKNIASNGMLNHRSGPLRRCRENITYRSRLV